MKHNPREVKSQTRDAFKWWNDLCTIQPGDSPGTITKRVLIRLLGIIFLAVSSPVLLLALLVAFLVML